MLDTETEDFKWQDYASCNGAEEPNMFYDDYENDVITAMQVDQICQHCPVATWCLEDGLNSKGWGVWGGIYLIDGKVDEHRNSHKNKADWKELYRIHGRSFIEP